MKGIQNSLPLLCDLKVYEEPTNSDGNLSISLRISPEEVSLGCDDCEIAFKLVKIFVSTVGYEVENRFGDPVSENVVKGISENERTIISEQGKSNTINGTFSKSKFDVSASVGRKKSNNTKESTRQQYIEEKKHLRVRAKAGDSWDITEPNGENLNSTYLDGSIPLCEMVEIAQSNQFKIDIQVACRQRHIVIDKLSATWSRESLFGDKSKDKLFAIFIAKTLYEKINFNDQYRGWIPLSAFAIEKEFEY